MRVVSTAWLPLAGLALLGALAGGCAMTDIGSADEVDSAPLPVGDVEDGRRAFLAHGCALCHGATRESAFPTTATTNAGPMIGRPQNGWTAFELAQAIVSPSHDVPPQFQGKRVLDDGTTDSPMAEYVDVLTLQDVADLVAYSRYLGE